MQAFFPICKNGFSVFARHLYDMRGADLGAAAALYAFVLVEVWSPCKDKFGKAVKPGRKHRRKVSASVFYDAEIFVGAFVKGRA